MRISIRRHMRVVVALCLTLALAAAFAAPKIIQASGETITDFSPSSGPARTVIAVHGSGLLFTNGVTIGGVSARWRVHSNRLDRCARTRHRAEWPHRHHHLARRRRDQRDELHRDAGSAAESYSSAVTRRPNAHPARA